MSRARLLGGTILGPAGMSPLPPATTTNVGTAETGPELLDRIIAAKMILEANDRPASVIVVGDDVPNGLEVSAGDVRFLTLSREGLERVVAAASPYIVSDPKRVDFPSLSGLPIVDLEKLAASSSEQARRLATYYRTAIAGFRRGLES